MSEDQRPPGLYLKPPHGELSFTGAKTALAKARDFGFGGRDFVLCSGPWAYGEMALGEPEAVGVEEFDARFAEHRVSTKERAQWWPDEEELWLWAYKGWRPYDRPRRVRVPAAVQTLMGPVEFIEEADMGQGVVNINISNAGAPDAPEDSKLLKAMAGDGGAIAELEGGALKVWKPSEAEGHTQAADTPEKRELWAGTANGVLKDCLGAIEGTPTEEQRSECEGKAIRIANAAVKKEKAMNYEEAQKEFIGQAVDLREGEKELTLDEVVSTVWRNLQPGDVQSIPSDQEWPSNVRVYAKYVDYQLGGKFYRRKYKVNKDGGVELEDPMELELVEKAKATDAEPVEGDDKAKSERERAKEAQEARAKKHGIAIKDGGNVTKPSEWADVPDGQWMDPVNYRYPCPDAKQTRAAAAYWGKPKNREQYSEAEQAKMTARLEKFKEKFDIGEAGEKSALGSLKEQAAKALVAVAGIWKAVTGEPEPPGLEGETGFKAFKAADGKAYILTWTTNAFLDRDGEIFSTASIEEYAERAWKEIKETGSKGQYDYWHAPGSEFADITWAGAVGRFLVEMGKFRDDEVGRTFQKFFIECPEAQQAIAPEGWKASHRYQFRAWDKADGVYEWFDKDRTSVLAAGRAANPYTAMEVITMLNDEQKKELEKIGEATGVDLLGLVSKAESETKRLEDANVAHKATEPPSAAEPPKADAGDQVEAIAKRVAELMQVEELGKMLQALADSDKATRGELAKVVSRLDEVEKGDLEAVKERESWRPNVPWFRASKADSTILDDTKDKDLKEKRPEVPPAILAVTERMMGQPPAGGRPQ